MKRYIKCFYVIATFFLLSGCIEEAIIPTGKAFIKTKRVTNVGFSTALLNATVINKAWPTKEFGFAIGKSPESENRVNAENLSWKRTSKGGGGYLMTGLESNTVYYARAYIRDTTGIQYGEYETFATKTPATITSITPDRVFGADFWGDRGGVIHVTGTNLDGEIEVEFSKEKDGVTHVKSTFFANSRKSGFSFRVPYLPSVHEGINKLRIFFYGGEIKFASGVSTEIEVLKR